MISAVILTKNEELNIVDCIESLEWCDEVIVIDDHSQDRTTDLAGRAGAMIYSRLLDNDFAQQRNFGLEKAKGDWVLFLDADERISPSLQYEILSRISESSHLFNGFLFRRVDTMWGKQLLHGETGNVKLLRLAKKGSGIWHGKVHEQWKIRGKIDHMKNSIMHFPHPTLTEFLKEINRYTDIRAYELFERRKKTNLLSIILYPKTKFIVNFFFKRGFLDGIEGLIFAILMSFHSFLVRGKLWLLWQKK